VDLYIPSLIRLHGVVLSQLSTGTILPFANICVYVQFYKDIAKSNRMPVDMKRARHWMLSERWLASLESWDVEDYTQLWI
jgi:hypothetical protein